MTTPTGYTPDLAPNEVACHLHDGDVRRAAWALDHSAPEVIGDFCHHLDRIAPDDLVMIPDTGFVTPGPNAAAALAYVAGGTAAEVHAARRAAEEPGSAPALPVTAWLIDHLGDPKAVAS